MQKLLVAIGLMAFNLAVMATPIPLSLFAKDTQFDDVKLSPDGKHFAATFPRKNRTALAIIERATMRPVSDFDFGDNEHIREFYWVNDERVVFTRTFESNLNEADFSYGELYAANIDGTRKGPIFGFGAPKRITGVRSKGSDTYSAEIIHMLPKDPKHVLISARSFRGDLDSPVRIIKLDVYSGRRFPVAVTPFGNMSVIKRRYLRITQNTALVQF